MEHFLNIVQEGKIIELTIDTKIFSKDIILKSSFNFLELGYFFFKYDENNNILLRLTLRDDSEKDLDYILEKFSNTLLETTLRDALEKENKTIRETIVEKAINGPFDTANFVSYSTEDLEKQSSQNEIDFDKDIDEILAEIENDPDLKIDEEEIEKILAEIEAESEEMKPKVSLNLDAVADFKNKLKKDEK